MKKFALLACLSATALTGSSLAIAAPAAKTTAPATRDWSQTVSATPDGGFIMGNPAAKVTLVEYGSLTCPHCAHFDEVGYPELVQNYVKTGKVAFEFRNYVRDAFDLAAALTARCGGASKFFPVANGLFKTQTSWIDKIKANSDKLKALQGKEFTEVLPVVGDLAGFPAQAAASGVPAAKVKACLGNKVEIDRLVSIRNNASFVQGTPTFLLNGTEITLSVGQDIWPQVEDSLKGALGS